MMLGEVTRDVLCKFEGWTLVVVSGDILVDGYRSSCVRFQLRSPDGNEDQDVYVEQSDERNGLVFYIRPAEDHQRRMTGGKS